MELSCPLLPQGDTVARERRKLLKADSDEKPEFVPEAGQIWRLKTSAAKISKVSDPTNFNDELAAELLKWGREPEMDLCKVWVSNDYVNLNGMVVVPFSTNFHTNEFKNYVARCGWNNIFFVLDFTHDVCRNKCKLGVLYGVGHHYVAREWRNTGVPAFFCVVNTEKTPAYLNAFQAADELYRGEDEGSFDLAPCVSGHVKDGNPGAQEACQVFFFRTWLR